jgi:hypothetical protein
MDVITLPQPVFAPVPDRRIPQNLEEEHVAQQIELLRPGRFFGHE